VSMCRLDLRALLPTPYG